MKRADFSAFGSPSNLADNMKNTIRYFINITFGSTVEMIKQNNPVGLKRVRNGVVVSCWNGKDWEDSMYEAADMDKTPFKRVPRSEVRAAGIPTA